MARREDVTRILSDLNKGDARAADRLLPLVYAELHAVARRLLGGERRDHTLQATALVHEAYLKLVEQTQANWQNRLQFFAVSAQAIRRILVDHARMKGREKRGGGWQRVSIEEATVISPDRSWDLLDLDEALQRLAATDERRARVVELRFFAGLKSEEIARLLGVTDRTVRNDWQFARAWLFRELSASSRSKGGGPAGES